MEQKYNIPLSIALIVFVLAVPVYGQDDLVTVRVGYRELQIVPEGTDSLVSQYDPFSSNNFLNELATNNDTLFWEGIGQYGADLITDTTASTFSIVQINETGFFQTNIGLSVDNQTLLWVSQLDSDITSNFTAIVESATDFFADDNLYWGFCEEIILLPGDFVGMDEPLVWRFKFHLVAESERWTLILGQSGALLFSSFEEIPCQSCFDWTPVFVIVSILAAVSIFGTLIFLNYREAPVE